MCDVLVDTVVVVVCNVEEAIEPMFKGTDMVPITEVIVDTIDNPAVEVIGAMEGIVESNEVVDVKVMIAAGTIAALLVVMLGANPMS